MRKLTVLHVVLSLDVGGLENGVVNLINGLDDSNFRSVVCCIKHGGAIAGRITKPTVKVYELGHYGGYSVQAALRLAEIMRQENVDVVHTRNLKAYFFGFLAAKISRTAAIVHSEHGRDYPFRRWKMLMQRVFSYRTDAIVALSNDLKRSLIDHVGIGSRKVKVIVNGVDTDRFASKDAGEVRYGLGVSPETIVIGAVGRLVAVKNIGELFRAVKELLGSGREVHVIVVGDGPLRQELNGLASTLAISENVRFLGERDDVHALYNAMDIYALTSTNEGISNTLLEAMASGLAVVASSVGGTPEIVKDGETGLLYPSGQVSVLVDLLGRLVDQHDTRMNLGCNARRYVEQERSLCGMVHQYEELYRSVGCGDDSISI